MYDTKLHGCIRINALNGLRKAFQSVYTGNKSIFNSSVLKVCQNTESEVCSLIPRYIHSEQLLMPIPVKTRNIIDCTCNSTTTFIRYFIMDGIHPILISRVLLPRAYKLIIRSATPSARIVSRFLMNCESKLELRLRGVDTVTSPNEVWTCFCIFRYDGFPSDVPLL